MTGRTGRTGKAGRWLMVTGGLLLVAATTQAQEIEVPATAFTLPNGLDVIVHEDHSAPVVSVNVWYHVGSGREAAGRRGFAHLFEHMMFQGSEHVGDDQHFKYVQEAGGTLNGSTNTDRTNYYETVPANYLELALWLEADRMGWLLPSMSQAKLDNQRDVVKNERRQNYENRPYGMASIRMGEMLYPDDHPYHWPTIGYQEDLTNASLADVQQFFRTWYAPNNASLAIAGDVNTAEVKKLVEKYFGDIPRGEPIPDPTPRPTHLDADRRAVLEDRVTLARLDIAWPTVEAWNADEAPLEMLATILGQGKTSRLYQRLVYKEQAAQSASAFSSNRELAGTFQVSVTARDSSSLSQMEREVYQEIARLAKDGPTAEELEAAKNGVESSFVFRLASTLGKADRLNSYNTMRGTPNLFNQDLARSRAVTAADIKRVAGQYLVHQPKVVLSIVPNGHTELAATETEATP